MGEFNRRFYECYAREASSDERDIDFICNRMSHLWRYLGGDNVDRHRVCKADEEGKQSKEYVETIERGCCCTIDRFIENPTTGNKFWIGFNYGH